jgi:two-component system LytT family response regulator
MYKAVIIDDESYAREIVKEYLDKYNDIGIAGEFSDGFSGLKGINELSPDIVFLDIQMPKLTGFEMLELLDKRPAIIFTTAYDQYAIKAFEENAVDYLLKPFSEDRFNEAVSKAIKKISSGASGSDAEKLEKHFSISQEVLNRIVVKHRTGIKVIPVDQVVCLEAQDDYVMIHLTGEKYMKQKTMKYFEDHLDMSRFIRVHRSYIVKIDQIRKIEPYEKSAGIIVMHDGRQVPVSRSGLSRLKEVLDI